VEANDYFIIAIVTVILCLGLLSLFLLTIAAQTLQDQVAYGVTESLFVTSLTLTIGVSVAGTVNAIVKRKG
jgi:hypothetical protein